MSFELIKENNTVLLKDLSPGDCFQYKGEIFCMVVNNVDGNQIVNDKHKCVISLETFKLQMLGVETEVIGVRVIAESKMIHS